MPPSRKQDLIEAAVRVFSRDGFHASGLERILHESGVSRMTLYNHFKSKDDLILAALHRRDHAFRADLEQAVNAAGPDAISRLGALFDHYERWFTSDDFRGCLFINAAAEFIDPASEPRRIAADHKLEITRLIRTLCEGLSCADPEHAAEQISLLIDGAIVSAHVIAQAWQTDRAAPARAARDMAMLVIERESAASSHA